MCCRGCDGPRTGRRSPSVPMEPSIDPTYTRPRRRHSSVVEQLFRKQQVLGSNPSVGSTPFSHDGRLMSLARVQFFSISLDGFGTGEGLTREAPFGHAGDRLHEWMFTTQWWRELDGEGGGSGGVDDAFLRRFAPGIGAEIMGAGKFGYPGWHEDPDWQGWWGTNPPFHTPVIVLTHHPRPSLEMEGGTTFQFLDASPAEALRVAREAADGKDVRIGGG